MPCYSGRQLLKDWVYAIDKDFHAADGTSATWAPGQPQHYGEECARLSLPLKAGPSSMNADKTLIAVGVEHDLHIYTTDTNSLNLYQTLKGHVSRVDALEFHPTDPNVLVSCNENYMAGSVSAKPTIIFWDLDKQRQQKLLTEEETKELGDYAADTLANSQPLHWDLTKEDEQELAQRFSKAIEDQNIKSCLRPNTTLHGQLRPSFDSQTFNSTGRSMAFLPGDSPKSNGDEKHDICIYDTVTNTVRLTLVAHLDAIMWIGFSPNDKYIASVAWDQTFRIWSHEDGSLLHTFRSKGQNWTGAFSKDSRFFAATSGEGRFWIWDVDHGIEIASQEFPGGRWCRSIDFSDDGKLLVVGGEGFGRIVVFDVKMQEIVQERLLSTEKMPEEIRRMAGGMLGANVRFLGDKKVLHRTSGDNGVEIVDLVTGKKWRFAPKQGENKSWSGQTYMLEKKGLIASVNEDVIRFWRWSDV